MVNFIPVIVILGKSLCIRFIFSCFSAAIRGRLKRYRTDRGKD